MHSIDSIVIERSAAIVFGVLSMYRFQEFCPEYHIEPIEESGGYEGSSSTAEREMIWILTAGMRLRHAVTNMGVTTRFIRRIDSIVANESIQETYEEGDLLGRGEWRFQSISPEQTQVKYECTVTANAFLVKVGIFFTGNSLHRKFYQHLLTSLKNHVESSFSSFTS